MHDLQQWSENEVSINQRQQLQLQPIGADKTTKPTSGAKRRRNVAINIDKINNRYKEYKHPPTKTLEQVARKTIRVATKVKDTKTFQQKNKTIDGKILTYTPQSASVQAFENHLDFYEIVGLLLLLIL